MVSSPSTTAAVGTPGRSYELPARRTTRSPRESGRPRRPSSSHRQCVRCQGLGPAREHQELLACCSAHGAPALARSDPGRVPHRAPCPARVGRPGDLRRGEPVLARPAHRGDRPEPHMGRAQPVPCTRTGTGLHRPRAGAEGRSDRRRRHHRPRARPAAVPRAVGACVPPCGLQSERGPVRPPADPEHAHRGTPPAARRADWRPGHR